MLTNMRIWRLTENPMPSDMGKSLDYWDLAILSGLSMHGIQIDTKSHKYPGGSVSTLQGMESDFVMVPAFVLDTPNGTRGIIKRLAADQLHRS